MNERTLHGASTKRITYYAFAGRPGGRIGQMLVIRENGRQMSQEWTGVTYRSTKEAYADMERLNCGGWHNRGSSRGRGPGPLRRA